jgi:hypothetical protein
MLTPNWGAILAVEDEELRSFLAADLARDCARYLAALPKFICEKEDQGVPYPVPLSAVRMLSHTLDRATWEPTDPEYCDHAWLHGALEHYYFNLEGDRLFEGGRKCTHGGIQENRGTIIPRERRLAEVLEQLNGRELRFPMAVELDGRQMLVASLQARDFEWPKVGTVIEAERFDGVILVNPEHMILDM